ncbi:MAG: LON peptidase substrate-binding domain-containing protein [Pseudorhodobacter sp.]
MKPFGDLPDTIPVFPLPGALLLPRARLPLHIFEPRYLQMTEDVMKTPARLIGMVQPRDGHADHEEPALHAIGCAGRLTGFSETDDGRYMISLTGVSRFHLQQEVAGFTPYRRCTVNWNSFDKDLGNTEEDSDFDRPAFLNLLARYFKAMELSTDWSSLKEAETELLINSLSMLCPFEAEDKQALLEAPSLQKRREILVTLMEFVLRGGNHEDRMQ